jgi:hypothetical protein
MNILIIITLIIIFLVNKKYIENFDIEKMKEKMKKYKKNKQIKILK